MYETRDQKLKQDMFSKYEYLVQRPYLNELFCLPICTPPSCYEPIQLLKIEALPEDSNFKAFTYILNAVAGLGETIGLIITMHCQRLSIYLGIKSQCSTALSLIQNGLQQTFPNSKFCCIEQSCNILDELFEPSNYCQLTSSLITLNESYDSIFLRDFINLIGNQSDYTAFFLAEPIKRSDIEHTRLELCEIYDVISYFSQSNYTNYKSEAESSSRANARSTTNTSGQSITNTCGQSDTKSHSGYVNVSASTPISLQTNRPLISSKTTTQTSTQSNLITTQTSQTTQSPGNANTPKNINSTVVVNKGNSASCATNNSEANAQNCSESHGTTSTHTSSRTYTLYQALSFSCPNRRFQEAVTALNTAIERYNILSKNTTFHFGAYFFSPCDEASLRAAYSYVGLGQSTYDLSPNIVNCMSSNHPDYGNIYKFLRSFTHPEFILPDNKPPARNATPITSSEFINSLYLPITSPFLTPP